MKYPVSLSLVVVLLAGCESVPSSRTSRVREVPPVASAQPATPTVAVAPVVVAPPVVAPVPVAPAPVAPAPVSVAVSAPVTVPAVVVPPPAPPVVVDLGPKPTTEQPLVARREAGVVELRWILPESDSGYRSIEIMRNTQEYAPGRTRVRSLRREVTNLTDVVPDPLAHYWYWLKLTRGDGTIDNIGPVAVGI